MSLKRVLVVAGSDSSGGAGLEADQKTLAAHGCYAMTATTALTAQDTNEVHAVHTTPPEFVEKQIDACIDDVGADVVKIGMLASAPTVQIVAKTLRRSQVKNIVVDPVMVSTSGAKLLPSDAIRSLREELLPLTTILTPNLDEAMLLLEDSGKKVERPATVDDVLELAKAVHNLGPKHVLLKGGHLPLTNEGKISTSEDERHVVLNILCSDGVPLLKLESKYIYSKNTHGTGCSLASAIAANLAAGLSVEEAVRRGNRYVEAGILTSLNIGKGHGPINHFHSLYALPFPPGGFVDYLLDRDDVKGPWSDHTEHEFVKCLADGTLNIEMFKNYLIQDYIFLKHFSRANALLAYKTKNLEELTKSAAQVTSLQNEMRLHLDYCAEFGLSKEDVETYEESQACTAYTRYVLDVGQSEDWFALQVVMLPCLIGYGAIARRLYDDQNTRREGNKYWKWIETYVDKEYTNSVDSGREMIEKHAVLQSANRIEELVSIFIHATKMETGFWEMGLSS